MPYSPEGTAETLGGSVPERLSVVPSGLDQIFNHYPGLHPGLSSAVPLGLSLSFPQPLQSGRKG
jgi:hypothetical protein